MFFLAEVSYKNPKLKYSVVLILTLKALLHGAIFHATCLAMMICAALQLQGEGCYTLQRVCVLFSMKASRLAGAMRSQYVVVMETLRDKLLPERVLRDATLDFDHCTACYTVQWSVQLVSQRRCETS